MIELTEHEPSGPIRLSVEERDSIMRLMPRATVTPVANESDLYSINPKNYVGLVTMGSQTIQIKPKIGIERTFFLLSYALNPKQWRNDPVAIDDDTTLNEVLAVVFCRRARQALRRHVLHGYVETDDSMHGIRGRIRFADQLRRHQRMTVPLEVTYDEHTVDILENQLLLAALDKLRRLQHLPSQTQQDVARLRHTLHDVTLKQFHPRTVPRPTITRLNQHYEAALKFADLILRNRTLELDTGASSGDSLLFDMADVFETFVHVALREALDLDQQTFPTASDIPALHLDRSGAVRLRPDISWWDGSECLLVGDIKYKRDEQGDGRQPDLYQVLAYAHAAQISNGTLIYAKSEVEETTQHETIGGIDLHVEALHLDGSPAAILDEIAEIASKLSERRASGSSRAA